MSTGLDSSDAEPTTVGNEPYSRTADAESVVLNLAKVLTYSRVLLYTLREETKEQGRDDKIL
jgi:hypothetical protein